jgi:hypothetical protein
VAKTSFVILRRLTGSELGWFAEPRKQGRAKGRQRGINFNSSDMAQIFPAAVLDRKQIPILSRRQLDGQTQRRRILFQEKNWRLVGDMVRGEGLDAVEAGDFFWGRLFPDGRPPFLLVWDVVTRKGQKEQYELLNRDFSVFLKGGMASWDGTDHLAEHLDSLIGLHLMKSESSSDATTEAPVETSSVPPSTIASVPSKPIPISPPNENKKRKRIGERLASPYILAEIVKKGMALSAQAQASFMDVLDALATEIRTLFLEADFIQRVEVNHRATWTEFKGVQIGFVDGGMANVETLGSAPLAIRVGSYCVIPGRTDGSRERFNFEIQLVDDLYESGSGGAGVYEDVFDDIAKMRDAARITCETAGLLSLTTGENPPSIALLHGPLVNPVSPYALGTPGASDAFPNFAPETLKKLLAGASEHRAGRNANFVAIYLEQLQRLQRGRSMVCGVVERPSSAAPGPVMRKILLQLHSDGRIDAGTYHEFQEQIAAYRITDSVIFECILDEAEYIRPIEIDKQEPHNKIPAAWTPEILSYPKPLTTYIKCSAETLPIRVESFPSTKWNQVQLMRLIVHMSRLLPRYSFPVGLDIVDKHAKVPEWMSRQMNAMLSAQLMRKAMEIGNPAGIRLVRRILSANTRDWLFRPDFRKG